MFSKVTQVLDHFVGNHGVLTKETIQARIRKREIVIEPTLHGVKACSVDVRLDNYFGTFRSTGEPALDPGARSRAVRFEEIPFFSTPYFIQPKTFVLAQTLEFVALPRCVYAMLTCAPPWRTRISFARTSRLWSLRDVVRSALPDLFRFFNGRAQRRSPDSLVQTDLGAYVPDLL